MHIPIEVRSVKSALNEPFKGSGRELFDLRADPAEKTNLIATHAAEADKLEGVLKAWQRSVLESLTGADYR